MDPDHAPERSGTAAAAPKEDMMELPGSSIPWLRAVGAAGAVAALVVGGAVTTAGAIDDPGGAEPAEVQVMATDADGAWFSCDIDVDLEGGPGDDGAMLATSGSAVAPEADGAAYSVMVGAGVGSDAAPPGAAGAPDGAAPGIRITGGAAVASAEARPVGGPDGPAGDPVPVDARTVTVGQPPALPLPSEVRPGTAEECAALDVTVGAAPVPVPGASAVPGAPAVPGTATGNGAGGQDQES